MCGRHRRRGSRNHGRPSFAARFAGRCSSGKSMSGPHPHGCSQGTDPGARRHPASSFSTAAPIRISSVCWAACCLTSPRDVFSCTNEARGSRMPDGNLGLFARPLSALSPAYWPSFSHLASRGARATDARGASGGLTSGFCEASGSKGLSKLRAGDGAAIWSTRSLDPRLPHGVDRPVYRIPGVT
jgi:hypothetical protein